MGRGEKAARFALGEGGRVDTPSTVSSALYGAQAGLKELAQVTLKIGSKLREIEK